MAFFKKHLTSNYSEILYDTHAIKAYDSLHQGSNESTIVYLNRVQDILECIHHTSDMSSITAISTFHAKILTGLKESWLQNKLAESKAKKWTTMAQLLRDAADMDVDFERSCGYSLLTFSMFYLQILVPLTGPTSHLQKVHNNHQLDWKNPNVGIARENTSKRTAPQPPSKVPPQNTNPQRKNSIT